MVKPAIDQTTEERILQAARKVFIERGMDGARMQDIADEAGINKALLHYYFRNKEKLFEMIFRETAEKMFPKMEEIVLSELSLFDKIRAMVYNYIDLLNKNPYLPLFVLSESNRNPNFIIEFFEKQRGKFVELMMIQIDQEVKKGQIRPIHPVHLIINMISMCAFPFVAKPIIQTMIGDGAQDFHSLMEQRKKMVADFIIDAIKK